MHRNRLLAGLALAAVLCACATPEAAQTAAPTAAAAGPVSPRPDCAPADATIYFEPDSATIRGASGPILRELVEKIAACRTAGGELRHINVVAYSDATGSPTERQTLARAREDATREALVAAGAPVAAIQYDHDRPATSVMQRHADITLDMW